MLAGLAGQAIFTQRALDSEYLARLKDFADFVPVSEWSALFEPSRIALATQSIDCCFSTSSESLREIRLVNQVTSKRYQSSSVTHSIHVEVRSCPFGPGGKKS
jgi:hypothetical protein